MEEGKNPETDVEGSKASHENTAQDRPGMGLQKRFFVELPTTPYLDMLFLGRWPLFVATVAAYYVDMLETSKSSLPRTHVA